MCNRAAISFEEALVGEEVKNCRLQRR